MSSSIFFFFFYPHQYPRYRSLAKSVENNKQYCNEFNLIKTSNKYFSIVQFYIFFFFFSTFMRISKINDQTQIYHSSLKLNTFRPTRNIKGNNYTCVRVSQEPIEIKMKIKFVYTDIIILLFNHSLSRNQYPLYCNSKFQ